MLQLFNCFNIPRPDNTNLGRSWLKLRFKEIQRFRYRRAHLNQSAIAVSYSDAMLLPCDCGCDIFIFIISFLTTPTLKWVLRVSFFSFFPSWCHYRPNLTYPHATTYTSLTTPEKVFLLCCLQRESCLP